VAPAVPIEALQTFTEAIRIAEASDYLIIGVLATFAVVALLLATSGLFGVISFTVAQRTPEFGTRMALGASSWDVIRLVARQSLGLAVVGHDRGTGRWRRRWLHDGEPPVRHVARRSAHAGRRLDDAGRGVGGSDGVAGMARVAGRSGRCAAGDRRMRRLP
jgi:hypothetical protein